VILSTASPVISTRPEAENILTVCTLTSSAKIRASTNLTSDTAYARDALPVIEKSKSFSSGLKVTASAAPENVPILISPTKSFAVLYTASPLTGIVPSTFQFGVNLISAASGYTLMFPEPIQVREYFVLAIPSTENRICSSSGLKVTASAAPDRVAILPEPTKSLALVVAATPLIRPRVCGFSANVRSAGDADPLNVNREPKNISLNVALSVATPLMLR